MKDIIASSEQNTIRSREEAVRRAKQKRLDRSPGETPDRQGKQPRRESPSPSGQSPAAQKPRTAQKPSGKGSRNAQTNGAQRRADAAQRPAGQDSRGAQTNGAQRRADAAQRPAARSSRSAQAPESPAVRKDSDRQIKASAPGARGKQGRRPSPGRKNRSFLPAVLVIVLLLFVLFVFPGIVPRVLREYSKTHGKDTTPPVIELKSDPDYVVYPGQEYEEEGYSASDDRDGDLTEKVSRTVEGGRICYRVSDEAGNSAVSYRQIPYAEVSANISQGHSSAEELAKMRESFPEAGSGSSGSGRIVYLTFDDGPGQYTERLLDTLERNGVHVTFFVTGAFPSYEDLIKKEYEAGHSIGVHTFSHDFDKIYADEEAFWKDIGKMQKIVVKQTGNATNLMRFAGGSSNTSGTWQSPGIMKKLTKQAPKKGFQYFDWNVSSGDGAAEGDSAMVISRITSQIQNYDESVVLCHDTKEYTVNAMEYLIPWLLDNGYTILPLSYDSEPAHHAVQ